jgi:hypothetical protein
VLAICERNALASGHLVRSVGHAEAGRASGTALRPDGVRNAPAPQVRVASQKLADGVWFIGGGSHNSLAVEFKDFVTVIEGPLNDARSNAVIAQTHKLIPQSKILVNADLYSPPPQGGNLANVGENSVALFRNIKRLKLDVAQHVPIHGNPGGAADFERIVAPVAAKAPTTGDGG